MAQNWLLLALFLGGMVSLPWLIRWLQQKRVITAGSSLTLQPKLLGGVSVGPHQKVVTVEVGAGDSRAVLVLGVTAQQISCLHVLSSGAAAGADPAAFARTLQAVHEMPVRQDPHV